MATKSSKAIIAVDIFGQPADMDALLEIASRHNLKVISDSAQALGAYHKGRYAGTLADIGGYSLNYHKHIHAGEGGILISDDDELAERMRLIRNHAEAVVEKKGVKNLVNMVGYNFRLGEIEAAIGIEQLKKLTTLIESRRQAADCLSNGLQKLEGLQTPAIRKDCTHVYYVYAIIIDTEQLGVSRNRIYEALSAEGVPGVAQSYINLHLLPMYQQKIAYGSKGFPWTIAHREVDYRKGICPVAEHLQDYNYLGIELCLHEFNHPEIDLMIAAFEKVWNNLELL